MSILNKNLDKYLKEIEMTDTGTGGAAKGTPLAPASATAQPTAKKTSPLAKNMKYGPLAEAGVYKEDIPGITYNPPDLYAGSIQKPGLGAATYADAGTTQQAQAPGANEGTTGAGTYAEAGQTQEPTPVAEDVNKTPEQTTGTETATSEKKDVMSYEDFIREKYDRDMEAAKNEHERAINDAYNAYALNRATYGTRGESLGRNGLAMSGYSDYADQVAYATSRGEIAAAGANRYSAEQNARDSYYANMLALQDQKDQAQAKLYQDYLDSVANGNRYTDEQIDAMGLEGQYAEAAKGGNAQDLKAREEYVNGINKALDAAAGSDPTELFEQLESIIEGDYNGIKIDDETRQAAYGALAIRQARNVDESNYADMKKNLLALKAEGKLSTEGYVNALQQIEQSIGELQYQKTNVRAVRNGARLEVQLPTGRIVTLDQEAAMWDKTSRNNFKGIGNQMNEFLNAYVGEEPGMLASKNGEKRLFVRLNDGWYEVKQNVLTDMRDFLVSPFLGAEYEQDKIGTVKQGIFGKE